MSEEQPSLIKEADRELSRVEKIWEPYDVKVWVVQIYYIHRRTRKIVDIKYVRAKTRVGAVRTAWNNCFFKLRLSQRIQTSARLACPIGDLGCTETINGKPI